MTASEFTCRAIAVAGLDRRGGSVGLDAEEARWEQPKATDEEGVPGSNTTVLADTQRPSLLRLIDVPIADPPVGFVVLGVPAPEEADLVKAPTGRISIVGLLDRNQWEKGIRLGQGDMAVLLKPAKGGLPGFDKAVDDHARQHARDVRRIEKERAGPQR